MAAINEIVIFLIKVFTIYFVTYGIVDRVCKAFEVCSMNRTREAQFDYLSVSEMAKNTVSDHIKEGEAKLNEGR